MFLLCKAIEELGTLYWNVVLKGDEFNSNYLSKAVASFFNIFVIVLLVEFGNRVWQSVAV